MGKDAVRAIQLGVADIVAGSFMATRKLGQGGCGVIYELMAIGNPKDRVACKAELAGRNKEEEILKIESKVMKLLNNADSKHSPKCIKEGSERNYNYVIMTLLGPSVSDLRKMAKDQKFSLFTCMAVTIQALDSLKEMHDVGYLHRDVKPSNFVVGLIGTARERIVYVVDFGLARSFMRNFEGQEKLRRKRKTAPFRGTVRYCSINVHAQEEQGRHDDVWSLIYMLMEMYLGELPWQNLDRKETEFCKQQSEQELLDKCPKEFDVVLQYLKRLDYGCVPKYDQIRGKFARVIRRECPKQDKLDWEKGGLQETALRRGIIISYGESDSGVHSLHEILDLKASDSGENSSSIQGDDGVHATTHSSVDDTIEVSQKTQVATVKTPKKNSQAKYVYKARSVNKEDGGSFQASLQKSAQM